MKRLFCYLVENLTISSIHALPARRKIDADEKVRKVREKRRLVLPSGDVGSRMWRPPGLTLEERRNNAGERIVRPVRQEKGGISEIPRLQVRQLEHGVRKHKLVTIESVT